MFFTRKTASMVEPNEALPGRDQEIPVAPRHAVLDTPMTGPWPDSFEVAHFGMGCFWGAERIFWKMDGVHSTAAGYQGGFTKNPTYPETCTGQTGHTEAVQVVYDPSVVTYDELLKAFWENHDPTTPNRQGNDSGTQYRSAVYTTTPEQAAAAAASEARYQSALSAAGFGEISTEIAEADTFYYAENNHQQYLHKNPGGYCNHGFCQVGYDLDAHGQGETAAKATLPQA